MRLTTWNCCTGPLERKLAALRTLRSDIAVVPECPQLPSGPQCYWLGENPRKGLAILTRAPWVVAPVPLSRRLPRYVQPLEVSGPDSFLLVAVWAMNVGRDRYVRGLHRAIDRVAGLIASRPTVIMGDFNANTIWDHEHPDPLCFSALADKLGRLGLVSAYHAHRAEAHGSESRATFYFYRHRHRPYHIDYCFIPQGWLPRLEKVAVGRHAKWFRHSDHVPVTTVLRTIAGPVTTVSAQG